MHGSPFTYGNRRAPGVTPGIPHDGRDLAGAAAPADVGAWADVGAAVEGEPRRRRAVASGPPVEPARRHDHADLLPMPQGWQHGIGSGQDG